MHISNKRGQKDNVVTYEHVCDNMTDLNAIPKSQSTIGSVALVLVGTSGGIEVYIANGNHEWQLFNGGGGD